MYTTNTNSLTTPTQLYIQSQQTIINDLRDTFSCKTSTESTNILKINTSTFSATRTAHHITHRLEEAGRRLDSIGRTTGKSKGKAGRVGSTSQVRSQQNRGEEIQATAYANCEHDMMEVIAKLTTDLQKYQQKIQQLENKLISKQNQLLKNQQRYLRCQKQLILQLNHVKSLLAQKTHNQDLYFRQKIQLQRIIDQNKIKVWELEAELRELVDRYSKWSEKEVQIAQVVHQYYGRLEGEEFSLKGLSKKGKRDQEMLGILKLIIDPASGAQTSEEDKENNSQLSNRGGIQPHTNRNYGHKDEQSVYRSQTTYKKKTQHIDLNCHNYQNQQNQQKENDNMLRFLMVQAMTLEKMMS